MSDLKTQIQFESSQAHQLSQQALAAFAAKHFTQGKVLMRQAVEAGNGMGLFFLVSQQALLFAVSNYNKGYLINSNNTYLT